MPTLQQQRQAIADGMAARRAATGEAERDAAGKAMTERRTGKAVVDDINRLATPQGQRRTLRQVQPVGALPASRGRGVYTPPEASTGGGIASPLTENDNSRTYHDTRFIYSNDYLLAMEVRPLKALTMTDADGETVVLNFDGTPNA